MKLAVQRPLTASGVAVTRDDQKTRSRLQLSWQQRAWEYYDALGPIKYAGQYYSRTLSKIELVPQMLDAAGEWVDETDPTCIEQLARITLTPKKRATYGRLLFLVGECYLACFFGETEQGEVTEDWQVVSCDELSYKEGKYLRKVSAGAETKEYDEVPDGESPAAGQCIGFRFWREHPRYSGEPDSSVRGVLDDCEELMGLKQAIRAQTKTRAGNNNILLINEQIGRKGVDPRDPSDNPDEDKFLTDLGNHLMTPIGDEGSAAAVVPLVVRVPDGFFDKAMQLIKLETTELYKETSLRDEVLGRIAIGLDMPREVLEGTGDANHWSAWQISEDSFKDHLEPFCDGFCGDLTEAYYQPTLKALGVADPESHRIWYTAVNVVSHPNKAQDAKDAYREGALSKEALRDACGFKEDDKPTDAEYAEWVGVICRDPSMATGGPITSVAQKPGGGSPPGADVPGPTTGDTVEKQPPQVAVASALTYSLMDWARLCIERARECAGAKLRTKTKEPALVAKIRNVPNRLVAVTLGPDGVNGSDPDTLVAGGGDLFAQHLQTRGIDPTVSRHLVRVCEEAAAASLFDLEPALSDEIVGLCALAGLQLA